MSYRKNKVRAFVNLIGCLMAAVSIFLPIGPWRVGLLTVSVICIGLGR